MTEHSSFPPDYLPALMLNEYAYCPRLCYLEWVQGEWAENYYTEDGKYKHRHVDTDEDGHLQEPTEDGNAPKIVRSVMLSSETERLIAKIDLVECEGETAISVYIQKQGACVGKHGECLSVKMKGSLLAEPRMFETSQVVLCGNIQISAQALKDLPAYPSSTCRTVAGFMERPAG